jgi:hypothetical protein
VAGKTDSRCQSAAGIFALHLASLGIKVKDYFPQTVPSLVPHFTFTGLDPAILFAGDEKVARVEPGQGEEGAG